MSYVNEGLKKKREFVEKIEQLGVQEKIDSSHFEQKMREF